MNYVFQSSNPCVCTSSTPTDPPCPDDCNCLKVCDITVNALSDDAVGPCAANGTLDISSTTTYSHDFCACGVNPVKWAIEDFDTTIFINASINSTTGVLTWITQGPDTVGKYGCVTVCVSCGDLKVYARVTIGVKDLCAGCSNNCDDCNACDGVITTGTVDTSILSAVNAANTSITGS